MALVVARRVALLASLAVGSACTSHRPIDSPANPEAARREPIRVRFAKPTAVALTSAAGDTVHVVVVEELSGRMIALSTDSVRLAVWAGRGEDGAALGAMPGAEARLARTSNLRVEGRSPDAAANRWLIASAAGVALLVAVAWWVITHMYET
jgi:hypothetical protein